MADPSTYRPAPGEIPVDPGVYRFRDERGRVIYVGKAKSLRQRLNSYFADIAALHPRTRQMVTTAASVEWTVVSTEVEALQLEYTWIKEFDPRFNVRYRDDKSYPWLAVTLDEEFPRLQVMRGAEAQGRAVLRPVRARLGDPRDPRPAAAGLPGPHLLAGVFKRAGQIGRPCLLGYIGKCCAPCVGRVSADEHRAIVEDFCDFMAGKTDTMITPAGAARCARPPPTLEFERAARLRDDLGALRRAMEKQAVVLGDGTDADVVAFAEDELEAAVQVFHVRGGRVRGQRGWVVDKVEDVDHRPTWSSSSSPSSTAASAGDGACRARCWCRCCPRTPRRSPTGSPSARLPGRRCGCRSAATSGRCMETVAAQRRAGAGAAQAQAGQRPDRPLPGAGRSCRRRWTWPTRRCGSSASTSATCRAPTWSPAWWCSRTACPARASTAGSSIRGRSTSGERRRRAAMPR